MKKTTIKEYNIRQEFQEVLNKTKWIDSEDMFEIDPFLEQAQIEIERATEKKVLAELKSIYARRRKENESIEFRNVYFEYKEKHCL
jgi:hypothetical protein